MIKDYHIHPQILQYPERFRAFADAAAENGVEEICITDHMPLLGSRAGDRIPSGRVSEYCRLVRRTAEEYQHCLSIKCGIEIDYHPSVVRQIEAVLQEGEFDYILGSSHLHVVQDAAAFHTHNAYAAAMFQNTVSAANSGYFDAIAHVDMHRWIFANPVRFPLTDDAYAVEKHKERVEEMLDAIRSRGLRLEINPHFAAASNKFENTYPDIPIVKAALEKGIKFSYGSDAHKPEDVGVFLKELRKHEIYGKALRSWEEETS